MLALLTELARDGELAAELCAAGVRGGQGLLTAVKPLLLSGVVAVQLGVVELLDAVQRPIVTCLSPLPELPAF
jgi:ABC-type nitrate/sulfonate/bicarbonate transport system permease component